MLNISFGEIELQYPAYHDCDIDWYKTAEKLTKEFFVNTIKKDFNIIDAGAQIGMYSVLFSKLTNGKIFAFEPTDTADKLITNLAYNQCSNVEVIKRPLGSSTCKKQDKIYKLWSQNIIDEEVYDFICVDDFVKDRNLTVDLIKIDVDSYDYEVLQGAKSFLESQNPIVVVELNHALGKRGYQKEDGLNFMNDLGYQLLHFYDQDNYIFKKR